MKITKPVEFLGAYVVSADLSMGWGGESGYCNLELVEEPKDGKLFKPPSLGTGCIFNFDKLSFGGILKRWTYSEDTGNGRRYSVVLESPASILAGTQIVLNRFQGTIYTDDSNIDALQNKDVMTYGGKYPTNIINIFASKENYEYGGIFGAANLNELGYPAANIIGDINKAISDGIFGGKIFFADTEYELDLSELSEVISSIADYRIGGDFVDLSTLISDICDTAVYDYTLTLTGTTNTLGVITKDAKIKIKVLSRRSAPNPNVISETIQNLKNKPDKQKNLISYNTGKEFADNITQKVLIGSQASRYWLAGRPYMLPIWGQLGQGQSAVYFYGNSVYEYGNMFAPIRVTIDGANQYGEGSFSYVDTNLLELRCAMSETKDTWIAYHILMALREGKECLTFGNFSITKDDFKNLLEGKLAPADVMDTGLDNAEMAASYLYGPAAAAKTAAQRLMDTRYNSLKAAANTFYGRSFLVAIPAEVGGASNNFRWIELDKKIENSWDIAGNSWAGDNASAYFPDTKFYDDNGKLGAVAVFPNYTNIDFSDFKSDYGRSVLGTNNGVVVNVTVDTSWGIRWIDTATSDVDSSGNAKTDSAGKRISTSRTVGYVKVDIPSCDIYDEYTTQVNGFNMLCKLIMGTDLLPGYHNMFGFENFDFPLPPSRVAPEYIGIPQQSNRYVWGPWFSFNSDSGQKGKLSIDQDTSLNPETFGTIAKMNEYANSTVNIDMNMLLEAETGSVELAESPAFSLADRFFGSGPYVTNMSIRIDATAGYRTTYSFANWTKSFGKLSRYNIDSFKKSRQNAFKFQKSIRDLFRYPPGRPINTKLLKLFEPKLPRMPMQSTNMIVGNFSNAIGYAINNPNNLSPGINMQAAPTNAATRGMGLNYMESFGAGYEQIFTPIFAYDQRDPARVTRNFNLGNY